MVCLNIIDIREFLWITFIVICHVLYVMQVEIRVCIDLRLQLGNTLGQGYAKRYYIIRAANIRIEFSDKGFLKGVF